MAKVAHQYEARWTTPAGEELVRTRGTNRVYTHAAFRGPYSDGQYGTTFHGSLAQARRDNEYGPVAAVVPVAELLSGTVTPALGKVLFTAKADDAKCPNTGVTHPNRLYSKCKDCGKEGAVNRGTGSLRAHKPMPITLENLLSF